MKLNKPSFTVGIEEEYLLVDLETLDLANDPPASLLEECRDRCPSCADRDGRAGSPGATHPG